MKRARPSGGTTSFLGVPGQSGQPGFRARSGTAEPLRRLVDIVLSGLLLVALAPILAVASIAVKLTSPGPIFYRSERVGLGMAPFRMLKFRTMVTGADRTGPGITIHADPRVTPVGRFLRSTKIDELPQLINVLRGEMTLIGPRPETPKFVGHYTAEQRSLLDVKPGITGPGQLVYTTAHQGDLVNLGLAEEEYLERQLGDKLRLDLEYLQTRSALKDVKILLQTVWLVGSRLVAGGISRRFRELS